MTKENGQVDKIEDVLYMDGYDHCIIGHVRQFNNTLAVYSQACVIRALVHQGVPEEDAVEFHYYNQLGAWMGEGTPCFLEDYGHES